MNPECFVREAGEGLSLPMRDSRHSSVPPRNPVVGSGVAFSPMSNLSGAVHPTGSPVLSDCYGHPHTGNGFTHVATRFGATTACSSGPRCRAGSLGFQLLVQTVQQQQQQQQISQMMSLVQLVQDRKC